MRVCLINPPRIQPKAWGKPNVFPPIVLASVAAVLEKKHAVSIIDAPTEGWENLLELDETKYRVGLSAETIVERVAQWKPDVVSFGDSIFRLVQNRLRSCSHSKKSKPKHQSRAVWFASLVSPRGLPTDAVMWILLWLANQKTPFPNWLMH